MSAYELPEEPTALDWASFYVESIKFGAHSPNGPVTVDETQVAGQLEVVLRDAGVTDMTGAELVGDLPRYIWNLAAQLKMSPRQAAGCFIDGLMHGLALGAGLRGTERDRKPKGRR